ncbi:MAG: hypothetical protein ACREIA_09890 [Opitutaceae bacterium]
MESFLKNRPIHTPASEFPAPADQMAHAVSEDSPFAPIDRTASPPTLGSSSPQLESAEIGCSADGASVRAIMERGRVTRIVVTCSCGKVTEVACSY